VVASSLPQVTDGKRSRSSLASAGQGEPCLSLATSVPLSVWQDHLTPWLSVVEAAPLRGVCKALRGVVDECPVKLGRVCAENLKAALTCFPSAQSLEIRGVIKYNETWEAVELLRRHGGALQRVTAAGSDAERLVWAAVRTGALRKVTCVKLWLEDPEHRQWLSDGSSEQMIEMDVNTSFYGNAKESFVALEHLRRLPNLRSLMLSGRWPSGMAVCPAFIPPSLSALTLHGVDSLVQGLADILPTSGACLQEIRSATSVCPLTVAPRLLGSSARARPRSSTSASTTFLILILPAPPSWHWAW
jgi:hypothetical protein